MQEFIDKMKCDQFTHAMRAVVDRAGRDYCYPKLGGVCVYDPANANDLPLGALMSEEQAHQAPPCIIGATLMEMGIPVPSKFEGQSAVVVLKELGFPRTIARAASVAQVFQDLGKPWGHVLDMYLSEIEEPVGNEVLSM